MAHRRAFYLYQRHKKYGDYWYVCYLDQDTGKQQTAKSIDCLKERVGIMDFAPVRTREEAAIIAQKALDYGVVKLDDAGMLFVDYIKSFWDYDHSAYIAMRNKLKENSIGREYAYNMLKGFQKNVEPLVPSGLKLCHVNTRVLDKIMQSLYQSDLSSGTIQILEYSFEIPLKEATRVGTFLFNPAEKLLRAPRTERFRGVLSKDEALRLRTELDKRKKEMFSSYYLGILLALTTGMRCSEIRALNVNDIVPSSNPEFEKILIRHSLAYFSGVKGTKSKYDRAVLISKAFADELRANASPLGIVLPSKQSGKQYLSAPSLRTAFYEVLEWIGISAKEREERNLTFHSLRHTFSTLCRDASISQEDRMLVLGHKSKDINDRYTHISDDALLRVSDFTQSIYSYESLGQLETQIAEASREPALRC